MFQQRVVDHLNGRFRGTTDNIEPPQTLPILAIEQVQLPHLIGNKVPRHPKTVGLVELELAITVGPPLLGLDMLNYVVDTAAPADARVKDEDAVVAVGLPGSEAIESLRARCEQEVLPLPERNKETHNLTVISIKLSESSPLIGNTLQDIDFRLRYHCMVLGVENQEGHLDTIQAKRQFAPNDIVWVVGEEADLSMLSMVI